MLKVELHSHSDEDPTDLIPHTTAELIDRAAALGYGALAITLHDRQLETAPWRAYAAAMAELYRDLAGAATSDPLVAPARPVPPAASASV